MLDYFRLNAIDAFFPSPMTGNLKSDF